jgi:hypothetical protein
VILFLPVLGLFLPTVFCALAVYVSANAVAKLPAPVKVVGEAASAHWLVIVTTSGTALALGALLTLRASLAVARAKDRPPEQRTRSPKGPKGELLVQRVASIWSDLPTRGRPAPAVVWYSNFNVLAHAYDIAKDQIIEVSAGLWDRVAKGDAVANTILAHETAHLVYRDPPLLRFLEVATITILRLLRVVVTIGLGAAVIVIFSQLASDVAAGARAAEIGLHSAAIILVAALVLVALPLCAMMIRRYAGFIASLIEIRADVSAALWTAGLDQFVDAMASDPTLHRSDFGDLRHSLFSLDLTHISETERIDLLRSTDRLITPKTRYFALSVALSLLLPINAATYLIEGGAFNQALTAAVAVALHAAAIAMVVIGSRAAALSWPRAMVVGTVLCLVEAVPRIDLAPLGYLFTNYAMALVMPGGFGADEMSIPQAVDDLHTTLLDVAGKVISAIDGGYFVLAAASAAVALRVLSRLSFAAPRQTRSFRHAVLPVVAASLVAALSSYDPWRDPFFSFWPLSAAASWFSWTASVSWMRLCAPSLAGLAALFVQLPCRR